MANKKEEISNEIAKKLVNMLYIVIILLVVNLAISISNVTRTNDFIDKNSTTDKNKDNNDSDTIPEYDVSKYKAIVENLVGNPFDTKSMEKKLVRCKYPMEYIKRNL